MDSNQPPEDKDAEKKKITFGSFRSSRSDEPQKDRLQQLFAFAKDNTRDTIGYVLLLLGILLMFFPVTSIIGSLIVGIIFGLYFIDELIDAFRNYASMIEEHGPIKSVIFGGTLLALFFRAPFVFVGAALIVGLKLLLFPEKKQE